jgi:hypothetical protein
MKSVLKSLIAVAVMSVGIRVGYAQGYEGPITGASVRITGISFLSAGPFRSEELTTGLLVRGRGEIEVDGIKKNTSFELEGFDAKGQIKECADVIRAADGSSARAKKFALIIAAGNVQKGSPVFKIEFVPGNLSCALTR